MTVRILLAWLPRRWRSATASFLLTAARGVDVGVGLLGRALLRAFVIRSIVCRAPSRSCCTRPRICSVGAFGFAAVGAKVLERGELVSELVVAHAKITLDLALRGLERLIKLVSAPAQSPGGRAPTAVAIGITRLRSVRRSTGHSDLSVSWRCLLRARKSGGRRKRERRRAQYDAWLQGRTPHSAATNPWRSRRPYGALPASGVFRRRTGLPPSVAPVVRGRTSGARVATAREPLFVAQVTRPEARWPMEFPLPQDGDHATPPLFAIA